MASGEANNPWLHIGAPSTGIRGVSGDVDTPTVDSSEIAKLTRANVFGKAQTVTPVALVDAAVVAVDASLSNTFTLLLTATVGVTRQLGNPTNLTNGCIYNFRITQSSAGSNAMTYGTKFKWPGGTAPVLSTGANAIDMISAQYYSDTDTLLGTSPGMKAFA